MKLSESAPVVRPAGSPVARRRIAFWMLASFFLCGAGVQFVAGNPADVPTASGGMGPCTADFTVVDTSNKPVYDAKIHVLVKYGFMSKRDTDLEVGTNSDGKARMEGLPEKLKKPPMEFTIRSGDLTKSVTNDPAANCHPTFAVTLGK
ncbi:MAG TPA: hypothetical protein VKO18_06980 [Terriglobia bacterium]|nr:hypothetical protein [Terriglobia bacterium]